MLISIIIPAYNEEQIIKRTLDQLHFALNEHRDEAFSWEIIVCDNCSTDKTVEIAAHAGAKIIKEPLRQISRVRNTGASAAQGDWLIFMDADSYPPPELIEEVIGVIEDGNQVGCGTTVLVEGGTLFNKLRMERLNPFFRFFRFSGGAFILCRQDAFQAIGGFSSHLYAFEDLDFVFRLKKYGRSQGKGFPVLHQHPLITSGRKGEYNLREIVVLYASNFLAVILFLLQYILPKRLIAAMGSKILGYWYHARE